jgi:hypothetical protein
MNDILSVDERVLQERVVDRYLDAIWCIASSRYVKGFVIGYTSMSGKERFQGYAAKEFNHLVIIADRLTRKQALDLELRLQSECKKGAAYGPPYKRKYCPDFRDKRYYPSAGQKTSDPMEKCHSVYMAWYYD